GVFLAEFLYAAFGVDDLLLTGIKRMALGADIDVQLRFTKGRLGGERAAAGAGHFDLCIGGMDLGFHWINLSSKCPRFPTGGGEQRARSLLDTRYEGQDPGWKKSLKVGENRGFPRLL